MHAPPPAPLRSLSAAAAVAVFATLVASLVLGISSNVDSQLVSLGDYIWPSYALEIRKDPAKPDCDLEDLDKKLETCDASGGAGSAEGWAESVRRRDAQQKSARAWLLAGDEGSYFEEDAADAFLRELETRLHV